MAADVLALIPGLYQPFLLAAMVSIVATLVVRRVALQAGVVARPKEDRWHRRTVPLLGGIALVAGTLAGAWWFGNGSRDLWVVTGAGVAMFGVGFFDDILHLKPSTKLTAQIVVACLVVWTGPQLRWSDVAAVNILLSIFWIVGITNALNLLDNMDGLCAGITGIAALGYAFSVGAEQTAWAVYAVALAGACAGFLIFNFKPASIFMGDTGSLFLGVVMAVLTLGDVARERVGLVSTMSVPVLLMLIPIFDTLFVTFSRKLSARAASTGGRDHTSHRLVAIGFTERQAVLALYMLAAFGGFIAVRVYRGGVEGLVLVASLAIGIVLLGIHLARVQVYDGADFTLLKDRTYTPLLINVTYKRRLFEVLLDACLIAVSYYAAYVIRFDDAVVQYQDQYATSLPIIIAATLSSFFVAGVYRGVWRYLGAEDMVTYLRGVGGSIVLSVMAIVYAYRFEGYSRSVFFIHAMLLFFSVVASRLSFKILGGLAGSYRQGGRPALIYGAGDGGATLVREIRNNPRYDLRVVGFVDDDTSKAGKRIMRVPVLGTGRQLAEIIGTRDIEVVVVSTDKLGAAAAEHLERVCFESGTKLLRMIFSLEETTPRTATS